MNSNKIRKKKLEGEYPSSVVALTLSRQTIHQQILFPPYYYIGVRSRSGSMPENSSPPT